MLYGGDIPFVQTANVKRAVLHLRDYEQTYNERGLAQSRLWPAGTVCFTIAANIADSAVLDLPACFPDSVVGIDVDRSKADVYFVKYVIDFVQELMRASSRGTTQDNLPLDKLLAVQVPFPRAEEQQIIGRALAQIDVLAERYLKAARRLAHLGDIAFTSRFLTGGDVQWISLEGIAELRTGSEPGADAYGAVDDSSAIPFARVKDLEDELLQCEVGIDSSTDGLEMATPADVLVSFDGTPGRVATGFDCAFSSGIRLVAPRDSATTAGLLFFAMRSDPIQRVIEAHATGTTILHASSAIPELQCPFVENEDDRQLERFLDDVAQLLVLKRMIASLLVRARRILLPQLMTGSWGLPALSSAQTDHVLPY